MRKRIPLSLERIILIKNRHCCCICQRDGIGQEVIVHHIDGNNSNNLAANLAVLCLVHASGADAGLKKGKLGSGKKLKPDEVREYKKIWERKIKLESSHRRQILPLYKKRQLEILYHFEIQKIKNEILSLKDIDKRLKEKFEYLDQLVFEDFISGLNIRNILLNAYSDIALFTIGDNERPKRLARSIWGLFLHLVGPDKVKMYTNDRKLFLKSLDVLRNLGDFAAGHSERTVLKNICDELYSFYEIASWYKFKKAKMSILKILERIKKSCFDFEDEKKTKSIFKERRERQKIIEKTLMDLKELQ